MAETITLHCLQQYSVVSSDSHTGSYQYPKYPYNTYAGSYTFPLWEQRFIFYPAPKL